VFKHSIFRVVFLEFSKCGSPLDACDLASASRYELQGLAGAVFLAGRSPTPLLPAISTVRIPTEGDDVTVAGVVRWKFLKVSDLEFD
jgi:hypothetical protein